MGFEEHDIPKLIKQKILKPLGRPPANCVKTFFLKDVQDLADDRDAMAKASDAVRRGGKKVKEVPFPSKGAAPFKEAA